MVRVVASLSLAALLVLGLSGITVAAEGEAARPVPRRLDRKPKFVGDAETIRFVNAEIREGWQDANLEPSPQARDGEWCRRVYLDVLGRIPTIDELQRFEREPAASRRGLLVHRLLDSDEYAEDYARYWAAVWSHVLVGRPAPSDAALPSLTNYEGLRQYLRNSLFDNKPYDVMVYELLTATGDTTPGEPGFNGATNFLIDCLDDEAVEATKRTATCFIGFRAQCAQCHCEPCTGWQQSQYWSLNAFFRQARVQRISSPDGRDHAILSDADFVGESNDRQHAEVYFQSTQGKMEVAYPAYVDGTKIDASGELQSVHRRAELGRLVIHSDQLGTAIANRMWAQLFGFGFSSSGEVDQLGLRGELALTGIPAALGHEFAARGFNLKQLIRWMVLSEPYSLSSRITDKNRADQHGHGMRPHFSHFYLRDMQPEQIYASILVTSGGYLAGSDPAHRAERDKIVGELAIASGHTGANRNRSPSGTVPLALTLMNGPLTSQATGLASTSLSRKLSARGTSKLDPIDAIFLSALSRKPTRSQRSCAAQLLAAHPVDPESAYRDIWWAVVNSNEFILNH
ncbi:MAG TPA: DUF1549 domain-containing protein [Pirellulales bacterium]|jgi:hypothetical protein|nr:DUF1549 domain-containing protein [Pirellulales bacterium]